MTTHTGAPTPPTPSTPASQAEKVSAPSPSSVTFRPFQPGDQNAFRDLNATWIAKHFTLEEKDREVLSDPWKYILQPGGHIIMAVDGDRAIGCCALIAMSDGIFEVAKMTIEESYRGAGLGRRLLSAVIETGRAIGARGLYLETNHRLKNAIHLYESLGFTHVPADRVHASPYARADVSMEMPLR
jgi:putative acetyltransferase